jgi:hypothetical protein
MYNISIIYSCERPCRRASGLDFTGSIRAAVRLAAVSAVCHFTLVLGAHRQKAMAKY